MFTITFDKLHMLSFPSVCGRCENSGLRRDGCPNCGGTGLQNDQLTVEASSLGLKPGEWPDRIIVDNNGDLYSYVRQTANDHGTRFYKSPGRANLAVLND